ncbi:type II toxin-antitoxin system VapC family toxin [Paracoccus sp. TOH]|uniref:PIN domain-containing protein n=1 Tax=Paracoccus simplex TaxID=2086346 RepID=A0ABV7S108_9RHOB|nr:type II toxin-antitoxin system VapC family toxin [Paracoccus sp. TOH]WJS87397.1 type II toxin-antitoxin system VapC family toxin [Paracoccus sp. TOH]
MIALDTNVVLRFLTQDDPAQFPQASALFARLTADSPGYLCREVLVEIVWVLERAYDLPRQDIAAALDGLLAAPEIVVEAADRVGLAVERYRQGGAGFSDHMIVLAARDAGCSATFSFDRKAVAQAGMVAPPPEG